MLETIKSLCEERQKVIVSKDKGSDCQHRAIICFSMMKRGMRI